MRPVRSATHSALRDQIRELPELTSTPDSGVLFSLSATPSQRKVKECRHPAQRVTFADGCTALLRDLVQPGAWRRVVIAEYDSATRMDRRVLVELGEPVLYDSHGQAGAALGSMLLPFPLVQRFAGMNASKFAPWSEGFVRDFYSQVIKARVGSSVLVYSVRFIEHVSVRHPSRRPSPSQSPRASFTPRSPSPPDRKAASTRKATPASPASVLVPLLAGPSEDGDELKTPSRSGGPGDRRSGPQSAAAEAATAEAAAAEKVAAEERAAEPEDADKATAEVEAVAADDAAAEDAAAEDAATEKTVVDSRAVDQVWLEDEEYDPTVRTAHRH